MPDSTAGTLSPACSQRAKLVKRCTALRASNFQETSASADHPVLQ
jgi:hypothetical protein